MTPQIATAAFAFGILVLFMLDRDSRREASPTLWIPIAWLAIGGSRVVSAWLDPTVQISAAIAYHEGNPLDRNVQTALLLLGVLVLFGRRRYVLQFLGANGPILLFFLYCGVSTLWSDYPDATFRRWIKALGDLVMVLIVLTDRDPSAARKLPARVGFLLIPLSILLMKYHPELARGFNDITGEPEYTGVATSKNGLGMVCMIFGLGSVWRFLETYRSKERMRRTGKLVAHGAVVAMAVWLFLWARSITALICFVIAVGLLVAMSLPAFARRPVAVHFFVGAILLGSFSVVVLGVDGGLLEALGRDSTLTGRIAIWSQVLSMVEHPWLGTGFESFWLGERLQRMLAIYRGINQAHNGYIEVFLNLGWVGIILLAIVLVTGYRNVVATFRRFPDIGRFRLAFFVIGIVINFAEASFKMMSPVWVFFLLAIMAVPKVPVPKTLRQTGMNAVVPVAAAGDGRTH